MTTQTFTKMAPPQWLLEMWKEIDEKTFGKGFDCFAENAVCNLGVADWHGRETIRANLRAFIDTGFTACHEVVEYWDSPQLKIFHGKVAMTFDDPGHGAQEAFHGPLLLHGSGRPIQGQPLDWGGWPGRVPMRNRLPARPIRRQPSAVSPASPLERDDFFVKWVGSAGSIHLSRRERSICAANRVRGDAPMIDLSPHPNPLPSERGRAAVAVKFELTSSCFKRTRRVPHLRTQRRTTALPVQPGGEIARKTSLKTPDCT